MLNIYFKKETDGQPSVFEIEESATVDDLKQKLGRCLKISSVQFEIRTPQGPFTDTDLMSILLAYYSTDPEPVISLYNANEFLGFLRVLKNDVELSCHVLNNSSTELWEDNSGSELDLESSVVIRSTGGSRKRKLDAGPTGDQKRSNSDSSGVEVSPTASDLDVSPNSSSDSLVDACGAGGCDIKPRPRPQKMSRAPQCTSSKCAEIDQDDSDTKPPFVDILPENRRHIVVVSTGCKPKCYCEFLKRFFSEFQFCRKLSQLRFNPLTPVLQHKGRVYLIAADEDTKDWVMESVARIGDPYEGVSLIDFLHLSMVTVVWPMVEKCLLNIFDLLENQNECLDTSQWAVNSREELDPGSDEAASTACPNEKIEIYMDNDSVEYISDRCNQLRYCFWMIEFFSCSE